MRALNHKTALKNRNGFSDGFRGGFAAVHFSNQGKPALAVAGQAFSESVRDFTAGEAAQGEEVRVYRFNVLNFTYLDHHLSGQSPVSYTHLTLPTSDLV